MFFLPSNFSSDFYPIFIDWHYSNLLCQLLSCSSHLSHVRMSVSQSVACAGQYWLTQERCGDELNGPSGWCGRPSWWYIWHLSTVAHSHVSTLMLPGWSDLSQDRHRRWWTVVTGPHLRCKYRTWTFYHIQAYYHTHILPHTYILPHTTFYHTHKFYHIQTYNRTWTFYHI